MFDHLLEPGRIGAMDVPNRIVMAPMGVEMVGADGRANDEIIAYYVERARGGVGLIVTEVCAVGHPHGATSEHQLGISSDEFVPDLRRLTDAVHEHGTKIALQLVHHGKVSRVDARNGDPVLVPSIPEWSGSYDMAADLTADELGMMMAAAEGSMEPQLKAMDADDIAQVTDWFADGARRARDAGFDGVEIHAAHGYVLSAFLSPQWNLRDDEYGGSVEHRSRLLCEVFRACRSRAGDELAIWCRLDAREYRTPDGIRFEDTLVTARLADEAGADAIHLSAYGDMTSASAFTEGTLPHVEAKHAGEAAELKRAVGVPVIAVGRIDPERGDRLVADAGADFVAMGRQMLADPETAAKLAAARPAEIRPCINCYVCVASPFFDRRVHCAVNPELGHELWLAETTRERSAQPKRVVVVGGGPAGMEAARVAASRGHAVALHEASPNLGGALRFAALVYEPNQRLLAWLTSEMERLGVDVRTESAVTPDEVAATGADHVIVAIGASRERSTTPGADLGHVVDGDDLRRALTGSGDGDASKLSLAARVGARLGRLTGLTDDPSRLAALTKRYLPLGDPVVVVGGGLVGIELAEFLVERDRTVTVLESGDDLAEEMAHPRRWRVLTDLRDHGATLVTGAEVTRITGQAVEYRIGETDERVPAEAVIIAAGLVANPAVEAWRALTDPAPTIIGDATGVGYLEGAMHEGYAAGAAVG